MFAASASTTMELAFGCLHNSGFLYGWVCSGWGCSRRGRNTKSSEKSASPPTNLGPKTWKCQQMEGWVLTVSDKNISSTLTIFKCIHNILKTVTEIIFCFFSMVFCWWSYIQFSWIILPVSNWQIFTQWIRHGVIFLFGRCVLSMGLDCDGILLVAIYKKSWLPNCSKKSGAVVQYVCQKLCM